MNTHFVHIFKHGAHKSDYDFHYLKKSVRHGKNNANYLLVLGVRKKLA